MVRSGNNMVPDKVICVAGSTPGCGSVNTVSHSVSKRKTECARDQEMELIGQRGVTRQSTSMTGVSSVEQSMMRS